MEKAKKKSGVGWWVILIKLGPKLLSVLGKLGGFLLKILKGLLGFKAVGAAASAGFYTLLFSWQMAVALIAFLLVHEYGHLYAMKKCGLKTKGIYLIPGFGAAAVSAEKWKSARDEVYIAIMGPLVGLVFILPMIGLYFITHNPIFAAIASIMSLINLFNLFPINPLDGGRVVKGLLYSFKGSVGFVFSFLCIFVAIALSYYFGVMLLSLIAIISLVEFLSDYGLKETLKRLQNSVLRAIGAGILCHFGGLMLNTSGFGFAICGMFCGFILVLFFRDIYSSTKSNGPFIIAYPWNVLKDLVLGFRELFLLKPSALKRVDQYEPMTKKQIVFYSIAFILTVLLMIGLVVYTGNIPGCELGREMLQ